MRVQVARVMAVAVAASLSSFTLRAQDECATATPIVLGVNGPFDSTGSTLSAPAWTCGSGAAGDVWYSFTMPSIGGLLTIDTEGSVMSDTVLEVFDACGGTLVGCDDDSGTGFLSSLSFTAAGGVTYFARVHGWGGSFGVHNVNVGLVSPDECSGAIPVIAGVNGPFSNVGATTSAPGAACSTINSDLWFVFTASVTGQMTVFSDTAGAGSITDTVMEVWDSCGGTLLACDDDGGTGLYSQIVLPITQGTSYFIRCGDFGTAVNQGLFNLTVSESAVGIQNEECVSAVALALGANGPSSNTGATLSLPSWPCGFGINGDVWYSYTTTVCGDLVIDTLGSSFDTVLEVFTGGCGALVSVGCNDDISFPSFPESSVTVNGVAPGQQYLVRVAGYNGANGSINLNVAETVVFVNDDCAGAIPVALGMNGPFNNLCATNSPETWPCGLGGNDVWFSFQANLTAPHTFRTCGGNYDSVIQLFDGACGTLVSLGCNDDSSVGPCSTPLPNRQSSVTASLTNGVTYLVRVGGFNGLRGTFPLEILLGNGAGSITMTTPSLCTVAGLDLSFAGSPTIGSSVTSTMSGHTGIPFSILTLGTSVAPFPTCPCVTFAGPGANWVFGSALTLTVPADASFLGLPVQAQGVDLLGTPAACNDFGLASAFTDIYTILIN